jgi:hypothetical protein
MGDVTAYAAVTPTADDKALGVQGGAVKLLNLAPLVFSADIDAIVVLTQAAYDALGTPDARTLYLIEEP